jgi:hypothetical protein
MDQVDRYTEIPDMIPITTHTIQKMVTVIIMTRFTIIITPTEVAYTEHLDISAMAMGIIAHCITTIIRIITTALTITDVIIPMFTTVTAADTTATDDTETGSMAIEIIQTAGTEMGITLIETVITGTTLTDTGTTAHPEPEIELVTGITPHPVPETVIATEMTEMEIRTMHVVDGLATSIRVETPGTPMIQEEATEHEHVAEPGRMNILFHNRVYPSGQDKLTAAGAEM